MEQDMTDQLQELLTRVYEEGVNKAKTEADALLEKARAEAAALIQQAQNEAEKITADAKNRPRNWPRTPIPTSRWLPSKL